MTKRETRLLSAAAAGAATVVAVGVTIHERTGELGTATPPFVMAWGPRADDAWWMLAAVAALAALVVLGPALARVRSTFTFAAGLFVLALGVALAVNAARNGTAAWTAVFDLGPGGSFEAANEVLAGLPALSYGVPFFLDRFAELVPSQPPHVAGHPPGLPVLVHMLGIREAAGLAALCAVSLAAIAPATYALARALDRDDATARRAGLLACAAPALMLFGVSSPDALFALAGTVTAALLCSRRAGARAAGCVALGLAALLAWSLLAIGAWAFLVAWARRGARAALSLAAGCALALCATQSVLVIGYGYDPIGTLLATSEAYRDSLASIRPYAFWVVGSPVAFAVSAGLVLTGAALVAAARRDVAALALLAVVAISSVLGFTKAEVERIWLPYVPILCVAAASVIGERRLRAALALLAAQALATQLLFSTVW